MKWKKEDVPFRVERSAAWSLSKQMTDTHVGKTKESCSRARLAYEMFRDMGVDLIANVGDVADHHYPTRPIRTTCSSVRVRAARCASSA